MFNDANGRIGYILPPKKEMNKKMYQRCVNTLFFFFSYSSESVSYLTLYWKCGCTYCCIYGHHCLISGFHCLHLRDDHHHQTCGFLVLSFDDDLLSCKYLGSHLVALEELPQSFVYLRSAIDTPATSSLTKTYHVFDKKHCWSLVLLKISATS